MTQARWAILVARHALLARAGHDSGPKRLGTCLQRVHTLAHSQSGRSLLRDHGVEVLEAVDTAALVRLSPRHVPQLRKVDEAIGKRRLEGRRRGATA